MPDNAITFCGLVVERGTFPLAPTDLCYPELTAVHEQLQAAIDDLAAEIACQRNPQLASRDAMRLGRLQVASELIDGCLK